jgi:hypothetical protein
MTPSLLSKVAVGVIDNMIVSSVIHRLREEWACLQAGNACAQVMAWRLREAMTLLKKHPEMAGSLTFALMIEFGPMLRELLRGGQLFVAPKLYEPSEAFAVEESEE